MAVPLQVVIGALLALGCLTALSAAIGLLRFPDFFSRLHASGKSDTLAQGAILLGLVIAAIAMGKVGIALKLLLISLFLALTTPAATYAIAHAAVVDGRKPWVRGGTTVTVEVPRVDVIDALGEEEA